MLNQNIKKITAISMLAFTIGISGASASNAGLSNEEKAYSETLAEKTYSPEKAGLEPAMREAKEEKFYLEWFESLSIEDKEKVVEILKEKLPKSNPVSVGDTSSQKLIKFSREWLESLSIEEMKEIDFSQVDFSEFMDSLMPKLITTAAPSFRIGGLSTHAKDNLNQ